MLACLSEQCVCFYSMSSIQAVWIVGLDSSQTETEACPEQFLHDAMQSQRSGHEYRRWKHVVFEGKPFFI